MSWKCGNCGNNVDEDFFDCCYCEVERLQAENARLRQIEKAVRICLTNYGVWPPSNRDRMIDLLQRAFEKYGNRETTGDADS